MTKKDNNKDNNKDDIYRPVTRSMNKRNKNKSNISVKKVKFDLSTIVFDKVLENHITRLPRKKLENSLHSLVFSQFKDKVSELSNENVDNIDNIDNIDNVDNVDNVDNENFIESILNTNFVQLSNNKDNKSNNHYEEDNEEDNEEFITPTVCANEEVDSYL